MQFNCFICYIDSERSKILQVFGKKIKIFFGYASNLTKIFARKNAVLFLLNRCVLML